MHQHRHLPQSIHSRARGVDFERVERGLWVAVLAFWVVGDIVTTTAGLEIGTTESNPFTQLFLDELGYLGLVVHKLPFLAFIWLVCRVQTYFADAFDVDGAPYRSMVLFMFATHGAWLVAWNCYVIYLRLTGSGYAIYPF